MNYYEEIKNELINNEIYKRVKDYSKNWYDLMTYYNVGKFLVEAQGGEKRAKYGDEIIKEYSKKLSQELGKKYNYRNLFNMRKFYIVFKDENLNALRSNLSWTHYRELIKLKNINEIEYYILVCETQNLSYRELIKKIKNKEYERLNEETKNKLILKSETGVDDFIKNPIIIHNQNNYELISEKVLKQMILEDLDNFLLELGSGFSYIASKYIYNN